MDNEINLLSNYVNFYNIFHTLTHFQSFLKILEFKILKKDIK
jgi:hypothetical protein